MIKIKGSEVKLAQEGFNSLPPRESIVQLLAHYLAGGYVPAYKFVDLEGKDYWRNEEDTLVISIEPEEIWRLGADKTMEFATNLALFVRESACDEFQTLKKGRQTIIRFWWD